MICIDVDLDVSKRDYSRSIWYDIVRALYQYSWINRKVVKTRNGIHVYIDVPEPKDVDTYVMIKSLFGDDQRRVEIDRRRWGKMTVDICFKNSEVVD